MIDPIVVRLVPLAFGLWKFICSLPTAGEMPLAWRCIWAKIAMHLRPSNQQPPADHMSCLASAVVKCTPESVLMKKPSRVLSEPWSTVVMETRPRFASNSAGPWDIRRGRQ
jgi:hypothetical protein